MIKKVFFLCILLFNSAAFCMYKVREAEPRIRKYFAPKAVSSQQLEKEELPADRQALARVLGKSDEDYYLEYYSFECNEKSTPDLETEDFEFIFSDKKNIEKAMQYFHDYPECKDENLETIKEFLFRKIAA